MKGDPGFWGDRNSYRSESRASKATEVPPEKVHLHEAIKRALLDYIMAPPEDLPSLVPFWEALVAYDGPIPVQNEFLKPKQSYIMAFINAQIYANDRSIDTVGEIDPRQKSRAISLRQLVAIVTGEFNGLGFTHVNDYTLALATQQFIEAGYIAEERRLVGGPDGVEHTVISRRLSFVELHRTIPGPLRGMYRRILHAMYTAHILPYNVNDPDVDPEYPVPQGKEALLKRVLLTLTEMTDNIPPLPSFVPVCDALIAYDANILSIMMLGTGRQILNHHVAYLAILSAQITAMQTQVVSSEWEEAPSPEEEQFQAWWNASYPGVPFDPNPDSPEFQAWWRGTYTRLGRPDTPLPIPIMRYAPLGIGRDTMQRLGARRAACIEALAKFVTIAHNSGTMQYASLRAACAYIDQHGIDATADVTARYRAAKEALGADAATYYRILSEQVYGHGMNEDLFMSLPTDVHFVGEKIGGSGATTTLRLCNACDAVAAVGTCGRCRAALCGGCRTTHMRP